VLVDYLPSVFVTNRDADDSNHPARRESSAQTGGLENKAVDIRQPKGLAGPAGQSGWNGAKTRGNPPFFGQVETLVARVVSRLTRNEKSDFH
tara:strand:+ start:369 stop:644 length:276 start_codon:yes stop_codon:yes gene_type:complete